MMMEAIDHKAPEVDEITAVLQEIKDARSLDDLPDVFRRDQFFMIRRPMLNYLGIVHDDVIVLHEVRRPVDAPAA
jgi:hypothetical protein